MTLPQEETMTLPQQETMTLISQETTSPETCIHSCFSCLVCYGEKLPENDSCGDLCINCYYYHYQQIELWYWEIRARMGIDQFFECITNCFT
jgi:hypothetical protein